MSTVEQIERVIEQLPPEDFAKLSAWLDRKRQACPVSCPEPEGAKAPLVLRDHSAFLNSYAPDDEGLYDDAASG